MQEKEHTKYYNEHGERVPSVTTVLKYLNKPELMIWSNIMGLQGRKYQKIMDQSAEIGTITHELIEQYCKKKIRRLDVIDNMNYTKGKNSVINAYTSFKKWFNELKENHDVEILHNELQLTCGSYGGTIDFICKIDGVIFLLDFKTSKSIYPSMFIQLAAYYNLIKQCTDINVQNVGILRLGKSRVEYDLLYAPVKKVEPYLEIFNSLLFTVINWDSVLKSDWNEKLDI